MTRAVLAAAVAVLAACGGGREPKLEPPVAEPLAAASDLGAATATSCAEELRLARDLQQRVIVLINRGDVPSGLQEPLQSKVNVLVDETARCSAAAARRFRELSEWLRARVG